MTTAVSPERLLTVIELQNAIAAAGMNADEVMAIVLERGTALTSAAGGVVAIVEGDDLVYRAVTRPGSYALGHRIAKTTGPLGRCIAERAPIRTDERADGSLLCVPLLYGESAVGALEVASPRANAFGEEDVETLRLLSQIIAIALHRAYTYPRPRYDSATDAITGLGNKRAFDDRIAAELTRNRRYKHSFSLALVDLTGIAAAVDRYGQAAGDDVLREVSRILQNHTRAIDAGFRIGADDFAIVMPGTSLQGARIVAERCRAHIRDARLCDDSVTARIGIVEAADETADELANRAAAAANADRQPA